VTEYNLEVDRRHKRGIVTKKNARETKNGLLRLVQKWKASPSDDGPLLRDIDKRFLENFDASELDLDYSPRTIKNYFDYLSALFKWAIDQDYVVKNPTQAVTLGHYKPPVHILKPEELQTLLDEACWYTKCWIMFGAFGGVRSSEIGYLRWDDIRLAENQFYVPGRKNVGAERWVILTPPLREFCVEALNEKSRSGLIMRGMHSDHNTLRRRFEKLFDKTGVRIPQNALRHSYGSHHLQHFDKQWQTAGEMGHSSPQTTYAAYRAAVTRKQAGEYWDVRAVGTTSAQAVA
jgi:integrase